MRIVNHLGDTFETGCEMVDVTSMHRPDTSWRFTDPAGHIHQWYEVAKLDTDNTLPALRYSPREKYTTPTLIWVKDGEEYWDGDDEPHDVGHHECKDCHVHIEPRYCADEYQQFMPGLRWCKINGEDVPVEEFERRFREAQAHAKHK